MSAPRLSVVVTACADSPALRTCLARVRSQADPLGAELLLVVNGPEASVGDARLELEKLCDQLVFEPTVGKSHALNRAVDTARGEVIAFTDDDAEPEAGWLAALSATLLAADRPAELVGTGGPVHPIFPEDATPAWFRERVESKHTYFLGPRHDLGPKPVEYDLADDIRTGIPIGANCAYRREAFASYRYEPQLGPNRETGMRGGEDTLLAMQLLKAGLHLRYCPDARVRHPVHPDRMRVKYVRRAYFVQGVEWARIRRLLDAPLPSVESVRAKVSRLRMKLWVALGQRALRGGAEREDRCRRLLFKYERWKGLLAELRAPGAAV
jgi:cellulose synthase/poly-beta-1,6-N-acetylglucosamine synthase-like glycosyltransferase